jgi:hypothetical protein
MKNCGSLPYELKEFAINLSRFPWFIICCAAAACTGQLECQRETPPAT